MAPSRSARTPLEGSLAVTIEPWVTLQDVAKHLQVAEETDHRWIAGKGLPATKAGRVWRFKLTEVDDWMRAGGANGGSSNGAAS